MTSTLPNTMLAWQKHPNTTEPVRVEVPVPTAPDRGFLVEVHAAGVCHSDNLLLNTPGGPVPHAKERYTLGHEGCGKIVQIGSEVKSSAFQVGDLISFLAGGSCHLNCWSCERGYTQLCPNACPNGLGFDGSFAPYVAIEESAAVVLPEGVSAAVGAVTTDAVTTAYRAVVNTANVQAGQTILVFGLGGLGFNGMQIILHLGARAIIVDKRQEVLDEALKFGVKREDIVPIDADVATWVQENNLLVDTTIDFAGVPSTFKAAQESVRPAGTVVVVGLLATQLPFYSLIAIPKHLKILTSFGGNREELKASLNLVAKGVIIPQVTTAPLSDLPKALHDLHAGKIKSRIALVPEELGK